MVFSAIFFDISLLRNHFPLRFCVSLISIFLQLNPPRTKQVQILAGLDAPIFPAVKFNVEKHRGFELIWLYERNLSSCHALLCNRRKKENCL